MSETTEATDTPETDETGNNREAAKYRRKLREAEGERDALAGQLQAVRAAEVVRLATDRLTKPDAILRTVEVADLLAEDGTVDPAKVEAAVETAITEHGLGDRLAELRNGNRAPREGYRTSNYNGSTTPRFENILAGDY